MDPTVFVWQGGQLIKATSLPQFNHTSGANTNSIQITNNSDVTLIYAMERMTPVTILPRFRMTAPADPNRQYNISLAPNQTGTADTSQYVTLTESDLDAPFSIEPLNTNVVPVGLRFWGTVVSSAIGAQYEIDTIPTDRSIIIILPQNNPSGGYQVSVWAYGTNGVPSTIRNTFNQTGLQGGSVVQAPLIPSFNAVWFVTIYGTPAINDGGFVYISPDYSPTITASPSVVNVQNVSGSVLTSAGELRYLGAQQIGTTTTYTINPNERALIIFTPSGTIIGGLTVQSHTTGPVHALTLLDPIPSSTVLIAYVNPSIDTQWDVMFGTAAGTSMGFVAADSGLPLMDIARNGQRAMLNSIPVTMASDQSAILSAMNMWNGTGWLNVQSNQQNMANSLSAVIASDYPGIPTGWHRPYDQRTSVSASNANATIVFPANTGKRWVIDYVEWVLLNVASVVGGPVTPTIADSGSTFWQDGLSFPAAANQRDRITMGPGLGLAGVSGSAVTLTLPAGGVSTVSRISAGGYLLPTGM